MKDNTSQIQTTARILVNLVAADDVFSFGDDKFYYMFWSVVHVCYQHS